MYLLRHQNQSTWNNQRVGNCFSAKYCLVNAKNATTVILTTQLSNEKGNTSLATVQGFPFWVYGLLFSVDCRFAIRACRLPWLPLSGSATADRVVHISISLGMGLRFTVDCRFAIRACPLPWLPLSGSATADRVVHISISLGMGLRFTFDWRFAIRDLLGYRARGFQPRAAGKAYGDARPTGYAHVIHRPSTTLDVGSTFFIF